MIDGFQFRHGGQTPAAPGHGETLHPGLGLVPVVVRVGAHIPIKAGDAVGDNPIIGFGKSRLDRLTSAMGWPWPCRELLVAQPHTTNKIKAIMPKRYHRAMFNPPAVNWGKIIITWPLLLVPWLSLGTRPKDEVGWPISHNLCWGWGVRGVGNSKFPSPPPSFLPPTLSPASWRR